jgi:predicted DNA-binding transcriptional regulator AlpA
MVKENFTFDTLLTEQDVSRITHMSLPTVRRWRLFKRGPKYLKIGAAVRYRTEDISAWLESVSTGGGDQAVASLKEGLGHG